MIRRLSLGFSPCPNDTFIFYALVFGRISLPGVTLQPRLEDVETLNRLACMGHLDITKVSYHAFGHLRREYVLLRSGGALGRGCGPLVVAREQVDMAALKGRRIAIPGQLTTASLLLQLYGDGFDNLIILPFHAIMGAVAEGTVDAGLIIHESRFTFQKYGLCQVLDLGAWWEEETGLPIPLGGILAKRSLGTELIHSVDRALAASVQYALAHTEETKSYVRSHAQELEEHVIEQHIALYVSKYSLELGNEGVKAVAALLTRAEVRGLIPPCELPMLLKG